MEIQNNPGAVEGPPETPAHQGGWLRAPEQWTGSQRPLLVVVDGLERMDNLEWELIDLCHFWSDLASQS